jgi:hypothetical protein
VVCGQAANHPLSPTEFGKAIRGIPDWKLVAVPCLTIPVHPGAPPQGECAVVSLSTLDLTATYKVMGSGISRPKLLDMKGSDGRTYRVLLKSGDDLRQDGVMEQLLKFVSGFLERDPKTRLRRMRLRTDNVQPLTQNAGLIEFVEKTTAMGDYLFESSRQEDTYKVGLCLRDSS